MTESDLSEPGRFVRDMQEESRQPLAGFIGCAIVLIIVRCNSCKTHLSNNLRRCPTSSSTHEIIIPDLGEISFLEKRLGFSHPNGISPSPVTNLTPRKLLGHINFLKALRGLF